MVMRTVSFKIHPEQYVQLKAAADEAGIPPGVYARMRALHDSGISVVEARLLSAESNIIQTSKADLKKVAEYLASVIKQSKT